MRYAFIVLMLALGLPAAQAEVPPEFARNMPLYPGTYLSVGHENALRSRSFDQAGREQAGAVPTFDSVSELPVRITTLDVKWHLPVFEAADVPYFSSRTHFAGVTLRHWRAETDGPLANYQTAENGEKVIHDGGGLGDITIELGSFLLGSENWRERQPRSLAVLAAVGATLPSGTYDHNAVSNFGGNHWTWHGRMGLHWQPWKGAFVDAGVRVDKHETNPEPHFGGLAPWRRGDDLSWDLSFGHRLLRSVFASVHVSDRSGDDNFYLEPRFAPNAPEPADGEENFPTPGIYRDGGTDLREIGIGVTWFAWQRLAFGLHYVVPQSGSSGQFDLPFTNRSPAGCNPDAINCQDSAGDTVLVDGQGSARSFADDRFLLTVRYQFLERDTFTCTGCSR